MRVMTKDKHTEMREDIMKQVSDGDNPNSIIRKITIKQMIYMHLNFTEE